MIDIDEKSGFCLFDIARKKFLEKIHDQNFEIIELRKDKRELELLLHIEKGKNALLRKKHK